jgi:hypothetical protein
MLGLSQGSETHHTNLNIASLISHTASISQSTTTTQKIVGQLQESSLDTKKAVETMNASLSDRIGLLNEGLEVILRTTVNNVRDQFIAELNSEAQAIKSPGSPFDHISCTGTLQFGFGSQNNKPHVATDPSRQLKRQVCYRRVYQVWFATITITSRSTSTQQHLDHSCDNRSSVHKDTSSRIIVDIRPHPWITLRGVLVFIDRQFNGTSSLNSDVRLRIYNLIPENAPIVKACETGDLASAQKLFAIGQASPYDVTIQTRGYNPGYHGYSTLLDLAIRSWRETVWEISESKFFDNNSDNIEVLQRKFDFFAFLVDCGLDPGEQMSFLPSVVSRLLKTACSSPSTITSQLGDMLRCLVIRSGSNPLAFDQKHEKSFFLASMKVVPEVSASIMGQDSWPLPEPLAEHEYNPKGCIWYTPIIEENAYSLLRDPTAIYTRARLRWEAVLSKKKGRMADVCFNVLDQSHNLPDHQNGAWDLAIRARLLACLEFGMSPKDTGASHKGGKLSVAQYYTIQGKKQLLESALLQVGWTPDSIYIMFDEEASALLVQVLNSFRPLHSMFAVRIFLFCDTIGPSRPAHPSWAASIYLKNRDIALNEGYRRYFPEEEEEILRVVNHLDSFLPIEDLPAVNGITQDFWD